VNEADLREAVSKLGEKLNAAGTKKGQSAELRKITRFRRSS
jgi:hypothetical protein